MHGCVGARVVRSGRRAFMETIPERGQAERLLKRVPPLACFSTAMFPVPSKPFAPVLEWSH